MSIRRYLEKPLDLLDSWLDRLTTYKLVLYTLYVYVGAAVIFSFFSEIPFKPYYILASALWLVVVCQAANWVFARLYKVAANQESNRVTALILSLILTPADSLHGFWVLALCGTLAMAAKYIIVFNRRHIFNPAAFGAVMSIVLFQSYASWWIGTDVMAPLLIAGGILLLRKMRRFSMVSFFLAVYIVVLWLSVSSLNGYLLWQNISATPLIFFATIMLTEPLTSPTTLDKSLFYAGVVGLFYSISRLHFAPEEALLLGNFLTFVMTPDRSRTLTFIGRRRDAEDIFSYIFRSKRRLPFRAGQYLEWTLPGVETDSRGNRRYFTISSSPTEKELMFTVKQPAKSSRFKKRLTTMKNGEQIMAGQLSGSFTLPGLRVKKLAFLAGGVGITPFRSMVKEMVDRNKARDIVMFYGVNSKEEIAFNGLFSKAGRLGLRTFYPVADAAQDSDNYLSGRLDGAMIETHLPDFRERVFYVSGPQGFVAAMRQQLLKMGVPHRNIHTDFFPGYN